MKKINLKSLVFEIVHYIPKGKVLTYKYIADLLGQKDIRIIGYMLHINNDPKNYPCHRVIKANGRVAFGYAFGGKEIQEGLLEQEGIVFQNGIINLNKYLWQVTPVFQEYLELLKKYDYPGLWPWFEKSNNLSTPDEIIIGAILTQNTNWNNVEKAIDQLSNGQIAKLLDIYKLGKKNIQKLKDLIKPAGFYNQKAVYLFEVSQAIVKKYKTVNCMKKISLSNLRSFLLKLKGIGNETADTILLYSLNKPIFVTDAYTKRFVKHYNLTKENDYIQLQKFFIKNLPKDTQLFQNYHALIVRWGKEKKI